MCHHEVASYFQLKSIKGGRKVVISINTWAGEFSDKK